MACYSNGRDRLNCFALVTYIPNPLGEFLDDLRKELVPGCKPHAHVTILPPRPIGSDAASAAQTLSPLVSEFLRSNRSCPDRGLSRDRRRLCRHGSGEHQLRAMHAAMNTGPLEFKEPFPYHPQSLWLRN